MMSGMRRECCVTGSVWKFFVLFFFLRGGEGLVSQTEKEGVVTQAVTLVVVVVGVEG